MSKSCNCIWAEDDGTCCLDQNPPIEATCPHWRDRVDPVTGESLGPIHPAPGSRTPPGMVVRASWEPIAPHKRIATAP